MSEVLFKRIILAIVLIAISVCFISFWPETDEVSDEIAEDTHIPSINEFITNEMSDTTDLAGMDKQVKTYMQKWFLAGTSLAIMRNDSLLYAKGYGYADRGTGEEMTPGTIMRVASVSKLITAAGIMKLCEDGKLKLSDHVFGDNGILKDTTYTKSIKDKKYSDITVENLLRHAGGFTLRAGDPMFSTKTIIMQNHLDTVPDAKTLLKCVLGRNLGFDPGTSSSYSNLGYLLLSLVIEEVSGQDYESYIQNNILHPCGCYDMHLANNYHSEKYPNESRYHMQSNDELVEEYNNSGNMVERCYGGNDVRALLGAGAWVASAPEVARFVACIDGCGIVPDILSGKSIRKMTGFNGEGVFPIGWISVQEDGELTRSGSMSGMSALIKYFPDGECWIMLANTSTWRGPNFSKHTSTLLRGLKEQYDSKIPAQNLFELLDFSNAANLGAE